jgi:putative hydrolase of HD superfamily
MKELLNYSHKLKHLYRTGWVKVGVDIPETVASHSWNMALMAMNLSQNYKNKFKYDYDKVIKMCLCHDLAESIIGDITPHEKSYKTKDKIEEEAMHEIVTKSSMPELYELFKEYAENKTPEAKLSHDLDKLDMYAQALSYKKQYPNIDFEEFKISATKAIQTELGKLILEDLQENS